MPNIWQNAMDHAVAVARKAGEVVQQALQDDRKRTVMMKSSSVDLVTQTDQKVEQLIIQSVKEKFPTHSFIGEESVAAGEACVLTNSPTWIIDPIDGTTNFVHTFPFVAVSIGFSVNKQVSVHHYSPLQSKVEPETTNIVGTLSTYYCQVVNCLFPSNISLPGGSPGLMEV